MVDTDFKSALMAGGLAGLAVDLSLFPIDTFKTRLQSQQGFWKSGGFRGVYSGILSVAVGSVPTAALFFCSYEGSKKIFQNHFDSKWAPLSHMLGASVGEMTACLVRVPVEVVKQRTQAQPSLSSISVLGRVLSLEGIMGLYRGFFTTVLREVPFSFMQFPLWEHFKKRWSEYQKKPTEPWQSSVCGAAAGAIASGLTTPIDVAKTRIMLAEKGSSLATGNILNAIKTVHSERGARGLFAGIVPRVLWISVGGAIFLGVYDKAKLTLSQTYYYQEIR